MQKKYADIIVKNFVSAKEETREKWVIKGENRRYTIAKLNF